MEYTTRHLQRQNDKSKGLPIKVIVYVLAAIFVIILWNVISSIILFVAIAYAAYRLIRFALTGFGCAHCMIHFFVSVGLVLVAVLFSSASYGWLPFILLMAASLYAKNSHN